MEIELMPHTVISDIQEQFRLNYPFLKIEFYAKEKEKLKSQTAIPVSVFPVSISIHPHITVSELENNIFKLLRIYAKVLRKAGNLWIPASLTHDWTLEKQNFEGEQMSVKSNY